LLIAGCQFLELLILPPRDPGWKPPTVRWIDHPGKIIACRLIVLRRPNDVILNPFISASRSDIAPCTTCETALLTNILSNWVHDLLEYHRQSAWYWYCLRQPPWMSNRHHDAERSSLAVKERYTMGYASEVEAAILRHVAEHGSCTSEELFRALSHFTLNQVFFAIDRLSRDGRVSLRHPTRCDYLVSAAVSGTCNEVSSSADRVANVSCERVS
jgi:hypothetical protein